MNEYIHENKDVIVHVHYSVHIPNKQMYVKSIAMLITQESMCLW